MALLEMKNISKSYSGNQVLKKVNLSIEEGEIHGLIGENGAGKSTLMNILFGMPVIHNTGGHEGQMLIDGKAFVPSSPMDAMAAGIGMVHQEFMLIPGFTITENVKLNRENTIKTPFSKIFGTKLDFLDRKKMVSDTKEALKKLHMDIDEFVKIEGLPVGYMQFVEIAREIDKSNLRLLILDEPTAVLTESEAEKFLEVIQRLAEMGIAILFITHRLEEIKRISHGITVLRDGEMILTEKTEDITTVDMARAMVGRQVELIFEERRNIDHLPTQLQLKDLYVDMPGEKVKGINLDIKKGEIFGLGGLAGQGKIGIANGIMGLFPTKGEIFKDGKEMKLNDPRNMLLNNVAFLSEDRKGTGLLLDDSIEYNTAYTALEIKDAFLKKIVFSQFVDKGAITENARKMIEDLDTRVRLNREEGMTVIITSSELAELRQICDRIAIVSDGVIQGVFSPDESDAVLGLAMAGDDFTEVLDAEA